ncbi:MAG: GNAT family N-acyltransferase [Planctomycetota bacterium]
MDSTLDAPTREDHAEPLPAARLNPPGIVEHGTYRLRFAATVGDLWAVQALRYHVFNEELGEGFAESALTGRDEDPFDAQCQHLMVEDTATGAVVGTYRMQLAGLAAKSGGLGLYSAGEFDLGGLSREALESGVELGRACVHIDHRHRRVLYLLWHGLIHFCLHHGKRSFFGCSSLTSQDEAEALRFYAWLEAEGYVHPTLSVAPTAAYRCLPPGEPADGSRAGSPGAPADWRVGPVPKVPKLFGTYLRIGAKILGPPAIDREFRTIDFLTWVDLTTEIASAYGHPNARL